MNIIQKSFLNSFVKSSAENKDILSVLSIISDLSFIDTELFSRLQQQSIITLDVSFSDLEPLLKATEFYYLIDDTQINNLISVLPSMDSKLEQVVLCEYRYLTEKLEAETSIDQYKFYYTKALELGLKFNLINPYDVVTKFTPKLIFNGEFDFLGELLYKVHLFINKKNNSLSQEEKLILATVLCWRMLVHNHFKEKESAGQAIEASLKLFSEIQSKEIKEKELYITWFTQAYLQKSKYQFDENDFSGAISSIAEARKIYNSIECSRQLITYYLSLGGYYYAEAELAIFKAFLMNIKEDTFNANKAYRLDLGKYYHHTGQFQESIRQNEILIELAESTDDLLWKAAALRELGISLIKAGLSGKKIVGYKASDKYKFLNESAEIFSNKNKSEFTVPIFFWLSKGLLNENKIIKAQSAFENGLKELMKHYHTKSKECFEFLDLFLELFPNQVEFTHRDLESEILKNFGSLTPFLQSFYLGKDLSKKALIQDQSFLERMSNPEIRIDRFQECKDENLPEILQRLRAEEAGYIPESEDHINMKAFDLPFYETYKLLVVEFGNRPIKNIRYFLYNNENINFLNSSNSTIYTISASDLNIQDEKSAFSYIRFFFDAVIGKHGRFFIIEEQETNLPFAPDADQEKKQNALEKILALPGHRKYLFSETIKQNTYWHFSILLLFKDSVFSSKVQLKLNTGEIRLYDENVVADEMPFSIDLKSVIK